MLSDIEVVEYPDLQRMVEMIRHCKNSRKILQSIAKESLSTYQMLSKKHVQFRSNIVRMFVEIYVADGDIVAAETLIKEKLADPAYTESPLLVAYNTIIIIIKAIAFVCDPGGRGGDNPFGGNAFKNCLQDIIVDPFQFYGIVKVLSTTSLPSQEGKNYNKKEELHYKKERIEKKRILNELKSSFQSALRNNNKPVDFHALYVSYLEGIGLHKESLKYILNLMKQQPNYGNPSGDHVERDIELRNADFQNLFLNYLCRFRPKSQKKR